MRIGVLSDSHGRVEMTARAVGALIDAGAELLIHLGDFETEAVVEQLAGHPARIVFGNCDGNIMSLTRAAERLGIIVNHPLGDVRIDDRRIVFTHGHLERLMQEAIVSRPDYLLHGHTHATADCLVEGVRVINPGALFRAARYTAAVLDPRADDLEFLDIDRFG